MASENLLIRVTPGMRTEMIKWLVFGACAGMTAIGVILSFVVFGSTITDFKGWGLVFIITAVMMAVNYGAKYASESERLRFSPMDLVQYLMHGFLWPAAWPTMADKFGFEKIEAPVESAPALAQMFDSLLVVASITA